MKRIEYWKLVHFTNMAWVEFQLVPVQTYDESHPFFNKIVEEVKKSGFTYRIIERVETLVEQKD